jgi:transcriptional/translational regulatory protein YebC/TACO1
MVPKTTVTVDVETGRKLLKLMDALDDYDDVQQTHSNFDLPEELLAELG